MIPSSRAPSHLYSLTWQQVVGVLGQPPFVRRTLTCPPFLQGAPEGSAVKDFVLKHTLPLVGHRKPSNDAKRYTRRPLVVVYYSVDFSFDYRAGEGPRLVRGCSGVCLLYGFRALSCAPGRG